MSDVLRLQESIRDTNQLISDDYDNITKMDSTIDLLKDAINNTKKRYNSIQDLLNNNISDALMRIREKIAIARSMSSRARLGMSFNSSAASSVSLDVPKQVMEPQITNEVKLQFTTTASDGLIFFIGDGSNTPNDKDYLAIELKDGKVVFRFRMGPGRKWPIVSTNTVNDGKLKNITAAR